MKRRGVSQFSVQKFLSHYRKISLGNTSVYPEISGIEKNLCIKEGGVITFPRRKLFVTQYRKFSLGNISVYREISGMEKFCVSEREGVSHFSVENFLSHSTKKFRWGTLRCIGKFRVTKNFMHRRGRDRERERGRERERETERGGGVSPFPVENFLSHSIENFLRGTLRCIGKFRVWKNFVYQRGREYHISPSKNFVTQYRKISLGNTSVYREISGNEKFYA